MPSWQPSTGRPCSYLIFQEKRLYTLKTRLAAAYKGVYALLIAKGAKDWIKDVTFSKEQYASLKTDIHHIFPEKWAKTNKIDPLRRGPRPPSGPVKSQGYDRCPTKPTDIDHQ